MSTRHDLRRSFRPRVEALESRALLSVCLVDRLTDVGEGKDFVGDLRYCIEQAQDGDSIQFAVKGTINLTRALPNLTRSISIEGPGPDLLIVRRGGIVNYRVFTVAGDAALAVSGLTISGGYSYGSPSCAAISIVSGATLALSDSILSGNGGGTSGGAICNGGTLTVTNTTFEGNETEESGGAIANGWTGTLTATYVTFQRNRAFYFDKVPAYGGAIANDGLAFISYSNFLSNSAETEGGAIVNSGTMTIENSTFSGNRAGGFTQETHAIWNHRTLTIVNSTISDNVGGGVFNRSSLTILNSTVTTNRACGWANAGCGIFSTTDADLHMHNSIVAGNHSPARPDLYGRLTSSGYNLIGDSEGGDGFHKTDLLDVDPLLGPLQDNGGPTFTHALLSGSPALNAGDPAFQPPPDTDQRGRPRVASGRIDIGAFERQRVEFRRVRIPATWLPGLGPDTGSTVRSIAMAERPDPSMLPRTPWDVSRSDGLGREALTLRTARRLPRTDPLAVDVVVVDRVFAALP